MVFQVIVEDEQRLPYVWLEFNAESFRQAELFVSRFIVAGDYDKEKYKVSYSLVPVDHIYNRETRCFDDKYPKATELEDMRFKNIIGESVK